MAFEEEFGCEIPDDAAEKIITVKGCGQFHRGPQLRRAPPPMASRSEIRLGRHSAGFVGELL